MKFTCGGGKLNKSTCLHVITLFISEFVIIQSLLYSYEMKAVFIVINK